jgi:hypothetical protein
MMQVSITQAAADREALGKKLDKGGWGVALIWIGIAVIFNLGWENGLFGLGVITLAGQLLRRLADLSTDWFAVALGICLCLVGLKSVLGIDLGGIDLLPILSIALGIAFVLSAINRPRSA